MSAWAERCVLGLVILLGGALTGCKKEASYSTAPEAEATAGEPAPSDPLAQLAELEQRMAALGLSRPAEGGELVPEQASGESPTTTAVQPTPAPVERERDPKRGNKLADKDDRAEEAAATDALDDEYRGADYCTSVCELSSSICELEVRICAMSQEHGDDPTYADACERAIDDCEVSGDACNECMDG